MNGYKYSASNAAEAYPVFQADWQVDHGFVNTAGASYANMLITVDPNLVDRRIFVWFFNHDNSSSEIFYTLWCGLNGRRIFQMRQHAYTGTVPTQLDADIPLIMPPRNNTLGLMVDSLILGAKGGTQLSCVAPLNFRITCDEIGIEITKQTTAGTGKPTWLLAALSQSY